jgi:hypothetical protein
MGNGVKSRMTRFLLKKVERYLKKTIGLGIKNIISTINEEKPLDMSIMRQKVKDKL